MNLKYLFFILIILGSSCKQEQKPTTKQATQNNTMPISTQSTLKKDVVKPEIELTVMKLTDALKAKDLNLYMKSIPKDFVFQENDEPAIDRKTYYEKMKQNWKPLIETNFIEYAFSKFELGPDFAKVNFASRWERKELNANGGADIIFSVLESEETWKVYGNVWLPQHIKLKETNRIKNPK